MGFCKRNLTPKTTKIRKFSDFQRLYAIFVKFSLDFVDQNVENGQRGTNLLSSRIFRKENCYFQNEKGLKLTPKMTKKLSIFQTFYSIFVKFSTNFVN